MALINCPECNKEISDKAEVCINCGYKLPKQESMFQGVYCPSCLDVGFKHHKAEDNICPFCRIEKLNSVYGTFDDVYDYTKNHPELKQSPEFSQEAYNKRVNYVPVDYMNVNSPKCPTCGSTNISKIGTINRMVSTGLFGLASSKIGKTHKCNNCGTTW